MKKVLLFVLTFMLLIPFINAESDYTDKNVRIEKNTAMYESAAETALIDINRYKDKYLKDMFETDYKGITSAQQVKIRELAEEILLAGGQETYTDMEKIQLFHDWITENFYYYGYPSRLPDLKDNPDNPYYLLTYEYRVYGKVRARCNGFTAMFVALARSQNIPAGIVQGYYTPKGRLNSGYIFESNVEEGKISHYWSRAYVDGRWVVVDTNADCFRSYNSTSFYKSSLQSTIDKYGQVYFDVSPETLSNTHIIFAYRPGARNLKYITNEFEINKLNTILKRKYNGVSNGKRINSLYDATKPETFFSKGDTSSMGYGDGRVYKIYWPESKSIYGRLDLNDFTSLRNLKVINNRVTSIYLNNTPALTTVVAYRNKIVKVVISGAPKLKLLSLANNYTYYVEYSFNTNRKAIIKSTTGGTVSVYYSIVDGKYKHQMRAVTKSGYRFLGWYNEKTGKKLSSKTYLVSNKTISFTYVAKFKKR